MRRRVLEGKEFMNYVMGPSDNDFIDNFKLDTVKVIDKDGTVRSQSLGQVPATVSVSDSGSYNWVMPIVVIVVSAMALMTLYAFLSRR
jgi:hypothetical protein